MKKRQKCRCSLGTSNSLHLYEIINVKSNVTGYAGHHCYAREYLPSDLRRQKWVPSLHYPSEHLYSLPPLIWGNGTYFSQFSILTHCLFLPSKPSSFLLWCLVSFLSKFCFVSKSFYPLVVDFLSFQALHLPPLLGSYFQCPLNLTEIHKSKIQRLLSQFRFVRPCESSTKYWIKFNPELTFFILWH